MLAGTLVWDATVCVWSFQPAVGDGLGMFFPMISVLVLAPLQLAALAALVAARSPARRPGEARAEPTDAVAAPAPAPRGVVLAAVGLLSTPAAVMVFATAFVRVPALHDIAFLLAEPGTLVWGPTWLAGCVAGGIALGRGAGWPMLLAPLYPLLGVAYMFS
jgi:hypothetical protein